MGDFTFLNPQKYLIGNGPTIFYKRIFFFAFNFFFVFCTAAANNYLIKTHASACNFQYPISNFWLLHKYSLLDNAPNQRVRYSKETCLQSTHFASLCCSIHFSMITACGVSKKFEFRVNHYYSSFFDLEISFFCFYH